MPTSADGDLPPPRPIGLQDLPGAAYMHWQAGDASSRRLVLRDDAGGILATWPAPEGLQDEGRSTARRPTLAQALSPDGRWLALVQGDALGWGLRALPDRPPTLIIIDLADGRERFRQPLLDSAVLAGLRAATLVEMQRCFPDEPRQPMAWEKTPVAGRASPAAAVMSTDDWNVPWCSENIVDGFNLGLGRLAWSPDSHRLAVIAAADGSDSDVYLLDTEAWRWWLPVRDPGQPGALRWHPDGERLFATSGNENARGAGAVHVDGAWLIDPEQGVLSGNWRVMAEGSVDDLLQGWTQDGEAIIVGRGQGCIICALWRLSLPGNIVSPFEASAMQGVYLQHVSAMPQGDWVALSGHVPRLASFRGDLSDQAASTPTYVPPGSFLLDMVDLELERVNDEPDVPMLYWGATDLPFLQAGLAPLAVGPGGKRQRLDIIPGLPLAVNVAPDHRWRVVYNPRGLWLFDAQNRQRGDWTLSGVTDAQWSPTSDRLLWVSRGQLWQMTVPDGPARPLGSWRGTKRPGFADQGLSDGVGWLTP